MATDKMTKAIDPLQHAKALQLDRYTKLDLSTDYNDPNGPAHLAVKTAHAQVEVIPREDMVFVIAGTWVTRIDLSAAPLCVAPGDLDALHLDSLPLAALVAASLTNVLILYNHLRSEVK
jgi:hypothetical protein